MHKNKSIILFLILAAFLTNACNRKSTPKPRGYFRIDFPEKEYTSLQQNHPFTFEYPSYALAIPDTAPDSEPHWLNLDIKNHKAKVHLSYKMVNQNLHILTEESRDLAYRHSLKASSINEQLFINHSNRVFGTIYEIKGNAASPLQFHLTDSNKHFIRGSFYISEIPNYDSLRPVIEFLQTDIYHLIETFSWE